MNPERWRRAEEIYHAALEVPHAERAAFVENQCGSDPALRAEVQSLLTWGERSTQIFGTDPTTSAAAQQTCPRNYELTSGTRLLHYEILDKAGQGGMGVVYKARDTRLGRTVAIKFLRPDLPSDERRRHRFLREARAACALRHPGIVVIHDIFSAPAADGIVMEYINGPTLDEKLAKGPLPIADCIRIAREVAQAAAAAHKAGIVHRDLKPSNIVFTEDNAAKILDFGIAKLQSASASDESATLTTEVLCGTAAYMSPEQAAGTDDVDARSDIFSLGVILYEMLTGVRPFGGTSALYVIHEVMTKQPKPAGVLRPEGGAQLDAIVSRMLEKDPDHRFQNMEEVASALEAVTARGILAPPRSGIRYRRIIWAAALTVFSALVAAVFIARQQSALVAVGHTFTAVPLTAYKGLELAPSFSPDGVQVAFCWDGPAQDNFDIYVKMLGVAEPLRLTRNPAKDLAPAWSPDGRSIAFLRAPQDSDGPTQVLDVMLIPAIGGAERRVGRVTSDDWWWAAMAWAHDGTALFVEDRPDPSAPQALYRLSIETGEKEQVTRPPAGTAGDSGPAVSPAGDQLAFVRATAEMTADIYVLDARSRATDTAVPHRITFDEQYTGNPAWYPDGKALFYSAGIMESPGLWVARSSGQNGRAGAQRVQGISGAVRTPAISSKRALAFGNYLDDEDIWRVPLRTGPKGPEAAGPPAPLIASNYVDQDAAWSPDGRRIAFSSQRGGSQQIWICDKDGNNARPLTSVPKGQTARPFWSPDGESILFLARAEGHAAAYVVPAEGGVPRRVSPPTVEARPWGWSVDGRSIYFCAGSAIAGHLWKKPIVGDSPAVEITDRCGTVVGSPQGEDLYFIRADDVKGAFGSLWRRPLNGGGGSEHKVLDRVFAGNFHVDPEGIYFMPDAESVRVQYLNFAAAKISTIVELRRHPMWGFSVAPDRSSILFTVQADNGSDLMLVEDFR